MNSAAAIRLAEARQYGEIASGRLKVAKIGRLTKITNDAEIEWRRSLPAVERRANLDRDAANYVRRSVQRGKH
jgi:hypothetical protein